MYVQMLDIYISKISDIFYIFENITIFSKISRYFPTLMQSLVYRFIWFIFNTVISLVTHLLELTVKGLGHSHV